MSDVFEKLVLEKGSERGGPPGVAGREDAARLAAQSQTGLVARADTPPRFSVEVLVEEDEDSHTTRETVESLLSEKTKNVVATA